MNKPSRRDFLKTSALAGAAASLGVARTAHAAGSDVLKIAVIGCSPHLFGAAGICLNVQKFVGQKLQIVALADDFADQVQKCLEILKPWFPDRVDVPPERLFVGLDAYQKAIDCGVDVVLLATPPGFRPQHYAAAVAAGKHVFMEAPCCTDAPGYRSLMETNKLADAKNLKVVVGLQRRHNSDYRHGVRKIQEGELGKIEFLRVYWNIDGGGERDLGPRPQHDPREMEFQIRNWRSFLWLSGERVVDQHVHNLDIANWVLCRDGKVENAHPVSANGMGGRVRSGNCGDIFDNHFVEFTYADGSMVFSQSRNVAGAWRQQGEAAHGEKGFRAVSLAGGPKLESVDPYQQAHVDLLKAIAKGTKLNEGWHGAASSMTAILGRMATYTGQVVEWDDAVAKGPSELPERIAFDAPPRHLPGADGRYPLAVPGA